MTDKLSDLQAQLLQLGYTVRILGSAQAARDYLLESIDPTATVGIGGSISVRQTGIAPALEQRGNPVFWHWTAGPEAMAKARMDANRAEVYLTSTNAITVKGQLVNIDGFGNRLAAMAFGPGKVCVIVGQNKLCEDLETAMDRIKQLACPLNARRLGLDTPCARTGKCVDCHSPQRFCNATLILDCCPGSHPMEILLVREDLGY